MDFLNFVDGFGETSLFNGSENSNENFLWTKHRVARARRLVTLALKNVENPSPLWTHRSLVLMRRDKMFPKRDFDEVVEISKEKKNNLKSSEKVNLNIAQSEKDNELRMKNARHSFSEYILSLNDRDKDDIFPHRILENRLNHLKTVVVQSQFLQN